MASRVRKDGRRSQIVLALTEESLTCKELADRLETDPTYVRGIVDQLVKSNTISKSYRGREVLYTLTESARMPVPRFISSFGTSRAYAHLGYLFPTTGKDTKAVVAASQLGLVATRLLMIGFKFKTLKDTVDPDSDSYRKQLNPLKQETRLLKLEVEDYADSLYNATQIYKQMLSNEDFWNPITLARYFEPYLDEKGNLQVTVNSNSVLEIYSDYIRKEE